MLRRRYVCACVRVYVCCITVVVSDCSLKDASFRRFSKSAVSDAVWALCSLVVCVCGCVCVGDSYLYCPHDNRYSRVSCASPANITAASANSA